MLTEALLHQKCPKSRLDFNSGYLLFEAHCHPDSLVIVLYRRPVAIQLSQWVYVGRIFQRLSHRITTVRSYVGRRLPQVLIILPLELAGFNVKGNLLLLCPVHFFILTNELIHECLLVRFAGLVSSHNGLNSDSTSLHEVSSLVTIQF